MKAGKEIGDALKNAALESVAEKVSGENRSLKHLFSDNGRQSLAMVAGHGVQSSIKNERLGIIAGDTIAKLVAGEKVSAKGVFGLALGAWLTRSGRF